jgi:hypothetical protein
VGDPRRVREGEEGKSSFLKKRSKKLLSIVASPSDKVFLLLFVQKKKILPSLQLLDLACHKKTG